MEIDFDKLLNDYLERLRNNTSDSDDELVTKNYIHAKEIAARVCISILKEYEPLRL